MDQTIILIAILGMTAATFFPRLIPIWWLSDKQLPPLLTRWLRYIPFAVLSAMLAPSLFLPDGKPATLGHVYLLAAIPTALIAWRTKSLMVAIVVGILLVALGRAAGL